LSHFKLHGICHVEKVQLHHTPLFTETAILHIAVPAPQSTSLACLMATQTRNILTASEEQLIELCEKDEAESGLLGGLEGAIGWSGYRTIL